MDSEKSSWRRTLWVVALVQCTMMMAFTAMTTFLPLYVTELGVQTQRGVETWSGILYGSTFILSTLLSPFWGAVADRHGRKLMLLRTTFAVVIFTAMMGICDNVWELLAARILLGAFNGFSASATALVATQVPENRLGFALGWVQSGAVIGTLVGPLFGGILADWLHNYRSVFFLTSAFALVAFFMVVKLIKEDFVRQEVKQRAPIWEQLSSVLRTPGLNTMFIVLFLAQFSVQSVQPVLTIFVKQLIPHNSNHLATIAGFSFAVTGFADLIASPFLGKRSDKTGYRKTLLICMVGAALFYIPQALSHNIWIYILSRFGLGVFIGGILPTANALIARYAPIERRGQLFGLTSSATFLGSFAGPLFGGGVSAVFGIRAIFWITAVLYAVNVLWVFLKVREADENHSPKITLSI